MYHAISSKLSWIRRPNTEATLFVLPFRKLSNRAKERINTTEDKFIVLQSQSTDVAFLS